MQQQTDKYIVTEKFVIESEDTWVLTKTEDAQITLLPAHLYK